MTRRTTGFAANGRNGFQGGHRESRAATDQDAVATRAKEMVSLRIDRDVLDHFQVGGPGWQDRINDALRAAAGK